MKHLDIYTDGSYVDESMGYSAKAYGYAIVIPALGKEDNSPMIVSGGGMDEKFIGSRNVAGELLGVVFFFEVIAPLIKDLETVTIHHDYTGVCNFCNGTWKHPKTEIAKFYVGLMYGYSQKYKIDFKHIKAHAGDEYNEQADKAARSAAINAIKS